MGPATRLRALGFPSRSAQTGGKEPAPPAAEPVDAAACAGAFFRPFNCVWGMAMLVLLGAATVVIAIVGLLYAVKLAFGE